MVRVESGYGLLISGSPIIYVALIGLLWGLTGYSRLPSATLARRAVEDLIGRLLSAADRQQGSRLPEGVIGHLLGTCESVVRGSGEVRVLTHPRHYARPSVESGRGYTKAPEGVE